MAIMSSGCASLLFLLLMASFLHSHTFFQVSAEEPNGSSEMKPLMTHRLKSKLVRESSKERRLGSFQICALCTCCGGPRGLCLPSPCCYAINCNIPNRPFGFCAFTPKFCNCFGCYL